MKDPRYDDDGWVPARLPTGTRRMSTRLFLDARIAPLRGLDLTPVRGWVHTAREALGMPTGTLARRAGITPRRVRQIERDEVDGHVQLDTMSRVAAAMGCRFVYAFVPITSFDEMVLSAAQRATPEMLAGVAHLLGMGESPLPALDRDQLAAVADLLARRRLLWAEPV